MRIMFLLNTISGIKFNTKTLTNYLSLSFYFVYVDIQGVFGNIAVQEGLLSEIDKYIQSLEPYKVFTIIDRNVYTAWWDKISIDSGGIYVIGNENDRSVEPYKNIETVQEIWRTMINQGFTRKSVIVNIGGGVVTDLGGFVASTFMRGIRYVNVPTTLMAQVDAAIGGKTGIDFEGKNLVGTFHQPEYVLIDPAFLKTLSEEHVKNGMAEVIKYGILSGEEFFRRLESADEISLDIIEHSVKTKADIVERDEKESGVRMYLNLGHTTGHALEHLSGYSFLHGYGVSVGIVVACLLGERYHSFPHTERVVSLLKKHGLPVSHNYDPERVIEAMKNDKKFWFGEFSMVMPEDFGVLHVERVDENDLREVLEWTRV